MAFHLWWFAAMQSVTPASSVTPAPNRHSRLFRHSRGSGNPTPRHPHKSRGAAGTPGPKTAGLASKTEGRASNPPHHQRSSVIPHRLQSSFPRKRESSAHPSLQPLTVALPPANRHSRPPSSPPAPIRPSRLFRHSRESGNPNPRRSHKSRGGGRNPRPQASEQARP